jgi:hypothetical protein
MRGSAGKGAMLAKIAMGAMSAAIAASNSLRTAFLTPLQARNPFFGPAPMRAAAEVNDRKKRVTTLHKPHGEREKARRVRQHAHMAQRLCHKPPAVQPRHIFGGDA